MTKEGRFKKQLEFIIEIDKLKQVYRQTFLMDSSRKENDAEHSWHLAMMSILLAEHALHQNLDITRVLKMVLIHDLVEIDAGDTYCYDQERLGGSSLEREQKAAKRLFGLLPSEQAREFHELWTEFEQRQTPEACFAAALDRFQPLLHNYMTKGKSWQEHGITNEQVIARNKYILEGSAVLWDYALGMIQKAVEKGYLE
ncbi:MAG: HD domain-containing protein [Dethiobacteria bacterium]